MVTRIPNKYKTVADEVIAAYTEETRNLHFRAFQSVPSDVAVKIMAKAVPDGYNNFTADLLGRIKGDVLLAREYSVCVYVEPNSIEEHELGEDEYNIIGGKLRLWWD
jgi:hypothetical protein